MKIFLGFTVQKQMGLLREPYAGLRRELLLSCCNEVCMKNGGRIPRSVIAICETYKISCLVGKHLTKGDSANQRTNNSIWFEGRISPYFCQRPVATASVRKERLTRKIPRLCIIRGEESGKETLWSQTLRNWKRWAHLKSMLKDSMRRKC